MGFDRHGRVWTYEQGPSSTRDALVQPSRMLDIEMLEMLNDEIEIEMQEELREVLQEEVREELRAELRDELRVSIREELGEELRKEIRESLQEEVDEEIGLAIEAKLKEMEAKFEILCDSIERAGVKIPFHTGLQDTSGAHQQQPSNLSQVLPAPSNDPPQESVSSGQ